MRRDSPWGPNRETLRCNDCFAFKPLAQFDKDRKKARGHRLYCKQCRIIRRARQICRRCGGVRERKKSLCGSCRAEAIRAGKRAQKKARRKNPVIRRRELARKIVREAIKAGALTLGPCLHCGSREEIHAHHVNGCDDVREWLNVVPLCRPCHQAEHRA